MTVCRLATRIDCINYEYFTDTLVPTLIHSYQTSLSTHDTPHHVRKLLRVVNRDAKPLVGFFWFF